MANILVETKRAKNMAMLHELRSQIDQGKTAVLVFKNEDAEDVKAYVRKNAQGLYTHTLDYPNRPNPFPQSKTASHSSWESLIEDIKGLQTTSDQWGILAEESK